MPLKNPVEASDPYTSRFEYRRLAPPRSVGSAKRHIAAVEGFYSANAMELFLSAEDDEPADDKQGISKGIDGSGCTIDDPIVLIFEGPPGADYMRTPPTRSSTMSPPIEPYLEASSGSTPAVPIWSPLPLAPTTSSILEDDISPRPLSPIRTPSRSESQSQASISRPQASTNILPTARASPPTTSSFDSRRSSNRRMPDPIQPLSMYRSAFSRPSISQRNQSASPPLGAPFALSKSVHVQAIVPTPTPFTVGNSSRSGLRAASMVLTGPLASVIEPQASNADTVPSAPRADEQIDMSVSATSNLSWLVPPPPGALVNPAPSLQGGNNDTLALPSSEEVIENPARSNKDPHKVVLYAKPKGWLNGTVSKAGLPNLSLVLAFEAQLFSYQIIFYPLAIEVAINSTI